VVDTDSSILERRNCIRINDSLPTQIQLINGEQRSTQAKIENIGEGGVCIISDLQKINVRKEVYIKLDLPACPISLDIVAIVVWIKEANGGIVRIGLKFSGIRSITQSHINKYIQSRLQSAPLKKAKKIIVRRDPLNKLSEKERRNLIILDAISEKGPIAKAEVSQIAGVNIGTITNYIEEYIKKGIVLETGLDVSTGGRRPTLLELNPRYGFCIGIDISNHKKGLVILICDVKGKIIKKYLSSTKSAEEFKINKIINRLSEALESSSISQEDILGAGIAVSGSAEKNHSDISQILERKFNIPVLLENASCASLFAERKMNLGLSDVANILYFSLISSECSLFINADLYRTSSVFSINMNANNFSKNSCWKKQESCLLKPLPEYSQENINDLYWDLGMRLAVLTNIVRPDVIILGDTEGREIIRDSLSEINNKVRECSVNNHGKLPKIFLAHFGQEAAALGAALLVARETFIQV
jgi:predicted NBD/HSP70 family sugar kinase